MRTFSVSTRVSSARSVFRSGFLPFPPFAAARVRCRTGAFREVDSEALASEEVRFPEKSTIESDQRCTHLDSLGSLVSVLCPLVTSRPNLFARLESCEEAALGGLFWSAISSVLPACVASLRAPESVPR